MRNGFTGNRLEALSPASDSLSPIYTLQGRRVQEQKRKACFRRLLQYIVKIYALS